MREGNGPAHSAMDEHVFGIFPRATWLRLLSEVGFEPVGLPAPPPGQGVLFAGRRRADG